jgi:hypothetical protein
VNRGQLGRVRRTGLQGANGPIGKQGKDSQPVLVDRTRQGVLQVGQWQTGQPVGRDQGAQCGQLHPDHLVAVAVPAGLELEVPGKDLRSPRIGRSVDRGEEFVDGVQISSPPVTRMPS